MDILGADGSLDQSSPNLTRAVVGGSVVRWPSQELWGDDDVACLWLGEASSSSVDPALCRPLWPHLSPPMKISHSSPEF